MRIIAEVPHPYLKITVFRHQDNFQISVKHLVYEILFNFRDGEITDQDTLLQKLPESDWIKQWEEQMYSLHQGRMVFVKSLQQS